MTLIGFVQRRFSNIFIVLFLLRDSISFVNKSVNYSNYLTNPCYGQTNSFVRDLSSCKQYYQCEDGEPNPGTCDDGYVFYAETEKCVDESHASEACFRCNAKKQYELVSVPGACQQYIQCMHDTPSLRICPNGLVFDGRTGIHQCNKEPFSGGCHREEPNDIENRDCPFVDNDGEPTYIVDPNNKSVYV